MKAIKCELVSPFGDPRSEVINPPALRADRP